MKNKNVEKILVNSAKKFELVEINELLYLLATGSYTEIHLTNKRKLTSTKKLKECCDLLSEDNLCRVCNSFAVNPLKVGKYDKHNREIIFTTGEKLTVPFRQVTTFQDLMKKKFISL